MDGVTPRAVPISPGGPGVLPNYVCEARLLTFRAPRALVPGEGFLVGNVFAVATQNAVLDGSVEGMVQGVFFLPKVVGEAWSNGVAVYWDNVAFVVTVNKRTPPRDNRLIGFGLNRALAADATGVVMIGVGYQPDAIVQAMPAE